jgi:hypothetical protein
MYDCEWREKIVRENLKRPRLPRPLLKEGGKATPEVNKRGDTLWVSPLYKKQANYSLTIV